MKRFLLVLVLAALHFAVQAQHYQSIFGKQSTSWEIRWNNLPGEFQSTISVQKDTLVNAIFYKKIVSNDFFFEGGLLREDTVSGKVWYKRLNSNNPLAPNDTTAFLIFDYSLAAGDTFDIDGMGYGIYGNYPDSFNVVKQVYYLNNLKHIEFKGPTIEPFTMIEGVGGTFGVIWKQDFGYKRGQYLLCSYKDGVKTSYTNMLYQGRCSITGISEDNPENQISIYPNPAQNQLFIKTSAAAKIKSVQVLNVFGKVVAVPEIRNDLSMDIAGLAGGWYVLQVTFKNGSMSRHKFVKQN